MTPWHLFRAMIYFVTIKFALCLAFCFFVIIIITIIIIIICLFLLSVCYTSDFMSNNDIWYICCTVCSKSLMQQHSSCAKLMSMCLHCFSSCIGFLFLNASNTDWPYWCFIAGMTRHRVPGKRPWVDCQHRLLDHIFICHPVSSWLFNGPDFSLSATKLLVPLLLASRTVNFRLWPHCNTQ